VTLFGLVWMSQRTHQMADAQQLLADRPEPVLVSTIGHLAREGGPAIRDRRWLTAADEEDRAFAASVLEDAGIDEFGLVRATESAVPSDPPDVPGFVAVETDRLPWFSGIDLLVTTYRAA
jgi:hypothetical protein